MDFEKAHGRTIN